MSGSGDNGVPVLGQSARVVIRERRIIAPAVVTIGEGGMDVERCKHHLRVVSIADGIMYYVPITVGMVDDLARGLQEAGQ